MSTFEREIRPLIRLRLRGRQVFVQQLLRNIVLAAMPQSWRMSAQADSKSWITDCTACGHRGNVWELGGVRWKAAGKPVTGFRCIGCGKFRMQRIHKP